MFIGGGRVYSICCRVFVEHFSVRTFLSLSVVYVLLAYWERRERGLFVFSIYLGPDTLRALRSLSVRGSYEQLLTGFAMRSDAEGTILLG